ncbi:MAG: NUDIX hydrolase [Pontiellaceae bacterium]|nr:NUDIX hydrolase [Pontiellaceae bacterium]
MQTQPEKTDMEQNYAKWARKVKSIAQIGLEYAENEYDRERYAELNELAAEMMAEASPFPPEKWLRIFAKESGYATPKVDVRGAAFLDGKVLLSREASDGLWSLPGGWADVNDRPSEAVIREVKEETGYTVRCTKLAAVLDRDRHYQGEASPFHIYKLMFLCEIIDEADALCHDILEARFFSPDELPPLSEHRTLPMHIELMERHLLDPSLPTQFD